MGTALAVPYFYVLIRFSCHKPLAYGTPESKFLCYERMILMTNFIKCPCCGTDGHNLKFQTFIEHNFYTQINKNNKIIVPNKSINNFTHIDKIEGIRDEEFQRLYCEECGATWDARLEYEENIKIEVGKFLGKFF